MYLQTWQIELQVEWLKKKKILVDGGNEKIFFNHFFNLIN